MKHVLVLHGPNLDRIGERPTTHYGNRTWAEIWSDLVHQGHQLGLQLSYYQSNHEGALIDRLSQRPFDADAVLLNAGGLTHTSVSLGDCVAELPVPFIEVHFSAVFARESFRHQSFLAPHAWGSISGFGEFGYSAALDVLAMRWKTA